MRKMLTTRKRETLLEKDNAIQSLQSKKEEIQRNFLTKGNIAGVIREIIKKYTEAISK